MSRHAAAQTLSFDLAASCRGHDAVASAWSRARCPRSQNGVRARTRLQAKGAPFQSRVAGWVGVPTLSRLLGILLVLAAMAPGPARAGEWLIADWQALDRPSEGEPVVIGSYAKGCLGGAQSLPERGPGYETIRMSRSRFWGHPELIDFIQSLGRAVARAQIGLMLIGDLSQPRGGPMPWGHASHQIGLDADIWFRLSPRRLSRAERETVEELPLVDYRTWAPTAAWTDAHTLMLRLAAADPRVDRIFVNPGIKKKLCAQAWPDRAWLRKLRPWWGHNAHFHVRLGCPPGTDQCTAQSPPPPGDGCDALPWWFVQRDKVTPSGPKARRQTATLPDACEAVFAAAARPERREDLLAAIIPAKKPTRLQR